MARTRAESKMARAIKGETLLAPTLDLHRMDVKYGQGIYTADSMKETFGETPQNDRPPIKRFANR